MSLRSTHRVPATLAAGAISLLVWASPATAAPTVENEAWLAGPSEVSLRASVEDFDLPTSCRVEYVSEADFTASEYTRASSLPCVSPQLPANPGQIHAVAKLSGLALDTTYHFRFRLSNESGEQAGPDQTFTTFGIQGFSIEALDGEGHPYEQAGGHPYALTTTVRLNTTTDHAGNVAASGLVKDVDVHLPPGLIGNPQAVSVCQRYDMERSQCPGSSQVGTLDVAVAHGEVFEEPLFNIVTPTGVAAEFGARLNGFGEAFIDAGIRTGSDYGVDADSLNITTLDPITSVTVTMWGVPADPTHDAKRACPLPEAEERFAYETPCKSSAPRRPFLTEPTVCSGPLTATVRTDAYEQPGGFVESSAAMPALDGCERLQFTPTVQVTPDTSSTDSPTGLHVDLHVPQEESAGGLAQADLRDATVTLPAGVQVNPAAANGLAGCSEAQIELTGPKPASCPDASKIGSVELLTPLLDHPLVGAVYLAQQGNAGPAQGSNEFGSLLALYIAIADPRSGVVVKLAGKVTVDPQTGQLTTTFGENPQLPFEDLKLDFYGGPGAALSTPAACGTYTTSTSLVPWSGGAPAAPTSSFQLSSGPGGQPCATPQPFSPGFEAGTANPLAASFTPFTTTLSREDGNQNLSVIQLHLPEGLLGRLAAVSLCPEPQASLGTCGAASQIGQTVASVGLGPRPYTIAGGPVFITGPYKGAPYGLSIAEPAKAGPLDLGSGPCDCVVVRARIDVDPHTSALTVTSDPLPTMLQGIPVQLKRVSVTVDRPGFTFNPTNCNQLAVTAAIGGEQGASALSSVPFEVADCAKLRFKPSFTVETRSRTSRLNGAYLHVHIKAAAGQANIGKVRVELPKQLPSRLSTLHKACRDTTFATDPASCPPESIVGIGKAVTPVLRSPLTGPAYLVSHAGAAFPDLVIVLQGEGITLQLIGNTDIKKGITHSSFNALPDAPISSFDLILPQGPHSALGAFGSICKSPLAMPTVITGQNGAVVTQRTSVAVTGCSRHSHKHGKKGPARRGKATRRPAGAAR